MIYDNELPEDSQDLFEHHRFVVSKGQGLIRIDKFLLTKIENASRNKIQQAAKAGNILVNGAATKSNYRVKPNDVISVVLAYPSREDTIIPEDIPLDILYEDEDIIVINKQAGMVVHPAYGNYSGTLVHALAFHLQNRSFDKAEGRLPFLVHRIDKDTSGIMVATKNELAQSKLARQFYYHNIERKYIALIWGDPKAESGTISGHIGRSQRDRKLFTVYPEGDHGKRAVTHYKVIEKLGYVTLIECQLETGRTHQIRVHFQHIKHPLFNDATYGGDKILKGTTYTKYRQFVENCFKIMPRQALHAKSLGFKHPGTNKAMYFEVDLPDDFREVLERWRELVVNRG